MNSTARTSTRTRFVQIGFAAVCSASLIYSGTASAGWSLKEALKDVGNALGSAVHSITHPSAKSAEKAAKKAVKDVGQAGKAAAKFIDQQNGLVLKTLEGSLHQADIGKSLEYLATNPLRQTNKNAQQALQSSPVLAVATAVVASAYGGPAGAAAFAAWTTYNVTGDLTAALKVGVTQGLIAAATAGVAEMPVGAEKIAAEAALKVTVSQATGGNSEEARQAALASLFSAAGNSVNAANLDAAQRSLSMAAIGGAAVAASGGNRDAIRTGFLQGGGKVLVQELQDAGRDAADVAKEGARAYVANVLSEEQISEANKAYEDVKSALTDSEAAQLVASAKMEYDSARNAIEDNVVQRSARLEAAHKAVIAERDKIAKENERIKNEIASIRAETNSRIAAAEAAMRDAQEVPKSALQPQEASAIEAAESSLDIAANGIQESAAPPTTLIEEIRSQEVSAIEAVESSGKKITADAELAIAQESERVRVDVVSAIREGLQDEKGAAQAILDDGTIVSWDPNELKAANNIETSVYLAQPKSADELLGFYFSPKDQEAE